MLWELRRPEGRARIRTSARSDGGPTQVSLVDHRWAAETVPGDRWR